MPPKTKKTTEAAMSDEAATPPKDALPVNEMQQVIAAPEGGLGRRDRLKLLKIHNFRCIGAEPVAIELDDIVVLVGANNAGKSTILRAYELAMLEGGKEAKLALSDFPNGKVDPDNLPQIELHTVVYANPPAERWIDTSSGEPIVKERWTWSKENEPPKRQGFDVSAGDWAPKEVPWGAAGVAKANRPQPHRINAFDHPDEQTKQIVSMLLEILKQKVAEMPTEEPGADGEVVKTEFGRLLDTFAQLQRTVIAQTQTEINAAEAHLSRFIASVFHGHRVEFDARPEDDVKNAISFFKNGADLRMGPIDGLTTSIAQQGSGARRALMWAALHYISENPPKKVETSRPHLLLLDEPELCMHPNAIRDACRLLYDLPGGNNWQVMVTTHSPAFIDLSRDNTTIVRVERSGTGDIQSTTVFRPSTVKLDESEKEEMKLLNLYDPYVAEFFFGGKVIIVEGDTEYTAFKYIVSKYADDEAFKNVHIIRARGKVTIALMARILNAFEARYAVLHDADAPTCKRDGKDIKNPAWTNNEKILEALRGAEERTKLVALVPGFEAALFGKESSSEKPYNALMKLRSEAESFVKIEQLLRSLVAFDHPLPEGCTTWSNIADLEAAYQAYKA